MKGLVFVLLAGRDYRHVLYLVLVAVMGTATLTGCQRGPGGSGAVPAPSPPALSAAAARDALGAFNTAFSATAGGYAYTCGNTAGKHSDFWKQAEIVEMVEDAFMTSHSPADRREAVALLNGAYHFYGHNWTKRIWNDDIMWMIIANARAYQITGDAQYLTLARRNFDRTYARAWSSDFGGGLWWTTARTEKNTTTNAPAAIAACLLYRETHNRSYLSKAERLYGWVRGTLFNAASGDVYDHIARQSGATKPVVTRWQLTYNQGSFIGAADLLYGITHKRGYYREALAALTFTKNTMAHRGLLPREGTGGNTNGGGFKGIFARWALKFTRDNHITSFAPWFRKNALAAWSHRNARGLMDENWSQPTGNGLLWSFDCSSAVVLLQALRAQRTW